MSSQLITKPGEHGVASQAKPQRRSRWYRWFSHIYFWLKTWATNINSLSMGGVATFEGTYRTPGNIILSIFGILTSSGSAQLEATQGDKNDDVQDDEQDDSSNRLLKGWRYFCDRFIGRFIICGLFSLSVGVTGFVALSHIPYIQYILPGVLGAIAAWTHTQYRKLHCKYQDSTGKKWLWPGFVGLGVSSAATLIALYVPLAADVLLAFVMLCATLTNWRVNRCSNGEVTAKILDPSGWHFVRSLISKNKTYNPVGRRKKILIAIALLGCITAGFAVGAYTFIAFSEIAPIIVTYAGLSMGMIMPPLFAMATGLSMGILLLHTMAEGIRKGNFGIIHDKFISSRLYTPSLYRALKINNPGNDLHARREIIAQHARPASETGIAWGMWRTMLFLFYSPFGFIGLLAEMVFSQPYFAFKNLLRDAFETKHLEQYMKAKAVGGLQLRTVTDAQGQSISLLERDLMQKPDELCRASELRLKHRMLVARQTAHAGDDDETIDIQTLQEHIRSIKNNESFSSHSLFNKRSLAICLIALTSFIVVFGIFMEMAFTGSLSLIEICHELLPTLGKIGIVLSFLIGAIATLSHIPFSLEAADLWIKKRAFVQGTSSQIEDRALLESRFNGLNQRLLALEEEINNIEQNPLTRANLTAHLIEQETLQELFNDIREGSGSQLTDQQHIMQERLTQARHSLIGTKKQLSAMINCNACMFPQWRSSYKRKASDDIQLSEQLSPYLSLEVTHKQRPA